jgi:2-isopropylmalate synthase
MLKEKSTYEIMSPEVIGLKESKLVMGKHSGRHAFKEKLIDLGYSLSDEQMNAAFAKFKELADKKKYVTDEDIRAIVEEKMINIPELFAFAGMQIHYGTDSVPTATVRVRTEDGTIVEKTSDGNGSVDAIYKAIDMVTGEEVELADYTIKSVSKGKDAQGEVHVLLKQNDFTAQGRGVSTDVLEASAKAYLDAANHLVDKRNSGTKNRDNVSLI